MLHFASDSQKFHTLAYRGRGAFAPAPVSTPLAYHPTDHRSNTNPRITTTKQGSSPRGSSPGRETPTTWARP